MSDIAPKTNNYSQPNPSIKTKPNKTVWMDLFGIFLITIIVGLGSYMILSSVMNNIGATVHLLIGIVLVIIMVVIFTFGVVVRIWAWHYALTSDRVGVPIFFVIFLINMAILITLFKFSS